MEVESFIRREIHLIIELTQRELSSYNCFPKERDDMLESIQYKAKKAAMLIPQDSKLKTR